MAANPTAAESAHTDANQQFSLVGVQGTLGTADLGGTARTVPLGADPTTGALYVNNIGAAGGGGGTNVNIVTGTVTTGTLALVTRIGNIGTIESGTVTTTLALNTGTLTTIVAGTQNTLGTVGVLNTGTLNALASGTITGGTLQNLVSGTINAIASGTITTGTVSVITGTLNGGTLSNLNYGTMTIDPKPVQVGTYYGTLGTTGAGVWGTLVPSVGNGLRVYVTGVDVVVASGTVDIAVTNNIAGSTGTGVFTRGQFVPGGGISKNFIPTLQTGTGGTIAFWMGGAGTAALGVQYWVAA